MWQLFLVTLMAALWDQGSAYDCYICSWSPKDENNRTNVCSDDKFVPQSVHRESCPSGCEIYIQWDLNGVFEHMRRNCAENITGRCVEETTKTHRRKQCTCRENLCNSAPGWTASLLTLVATTTALFASCR